MSQLFIALISWEVQLVKAKSGKREKTLHYIQVRFSQFCFFQKCFNYVCLANVLYLPGMSRWQAVSGAIVTVDLELLDAVHALQSSKTLEGNLGRAGDKL